MYIAAFLALEALFVYLLVRAAGLQKDQILEDREQMEYIRRRRRQKEERKREEQPVIGADDE